MSGAKNNAPSITGRAYRQLYESHTFVVLDTETCDADDGRHAIQIATTTLKRGRIAGRWSTLVNPGVPITNTKYHHLNDELVADAPPFADVVADLEAQLAGDDVILVAQNASHDMSTLRREYERLGEGRDLVELPVIDTMYLPAVVGHQVEDRKLSTLLASFGLENAKHHDAADDADATAELLLALLKVAASNGFTDIERLRAEAGTRTTLSWAKASAKRNSQAQPPEHAHRRPRRLARHRSRPVAEQHRARGVGGYRPRVHTPALRHAARTRGGRRGMCARAPQAPQQAPEVLRCGR